MSVGKYAQCKEAYGKFLSQYPGDGEALAGLGWSLYNDGQKKKGLATEKKAILFNKSNASAHHYLGLMYLQENKMQAAAAELQYAVKLNPNIKCHCGALESIVKYSLMQKANIQEQPAIKQNVLNGSTVDGGIRQ